MTWAKGQSGNPGGRPRIPAELKDAARSHTAEALKTLLSVMRSKKAGPAARVTAATEVLNRGWGRPQQHVDVTGEVRHIMEQIIEASYQQPEQPGSAVQ